LIIDTRPQARGFAPAALLRRFAAIWLVLTAIILGSPSARAQNAESQTIKRLAARFYRTYLRLHILGLPNSAQMTELSPYLTSDLRARFRAARRKEDAAIKRRPGEKPPFGDGDLFSSLFEGAQTFYVTDPAIRGGAARLPVHMQRRSPAPAVRWIDTLILERTADGWRVANIRYGGKWKFRGGPSLRDNLKAD